MGSKANLSLPATFAPSQDGGAGDHDVAQWFPNFPQASNVATYIAHGDVALSVLMTTASTVGAIFMTPLLTKALAGALVPVDAAVRLSGHLRIPALLVTFSRAQAFR